MTENPLCGPRVAVTVVEEAGGQVPSGPRNFGFRSISEVPASTGRLSAADQRPDIFSQSSRCGNVVCINRSTAVSAREAGIFSCAVKPESDLQVIVVPFPRKIDLSIADQLDFRHGAAIQAKARNELVSVRESLFARGCHFRIVRSWYGFFHARKHSVQVVFGRLASAYAVRQCPWEIPHAHILAPPPAVQLSGRPASCAPRRTAPRSNGPPRDFPAHRLLGLALRRLPSQSLLR